MRVPEYSIFQSDFYLWNILKWFSVAILVVIIMILGISLIRVNKKVNALNALILDIALTSIQKTSSYEFCQDTSNTLSTAISTVDYCPMRSALTSFSLREVSPPKRGLKNYQRSTKIALLTHLTISVLVLTGLCRDLKTISIFQKRKFSFLKKLQFVISTNDLLYPFRFR